MSTWSDTDPFKPFRPFSSAPLCVISHRNKKSSPRTRTDPDRPFLFGPVPPKQTWSAPFWCGCFRSIAMSRQRCVSVRAPPTDHSNAVAPFVQEYDKCFNLVRECAPHARIAYDCTSIESFRECFFPVRPSLRIHHSHSIPPSARR